MYNMIEIYQALDKTPLFKDISKEHYQNIFSCLNSYEKVYNKKEIISGLDVMTHTGIVISGQIKLSFVNKNGDQHSIKYYIKGEIFGEVMNISDFSSNTLIEADTDCRVLFLDLSQLFSAKAKFCPYASAVSVNLLKEMIDINVFLKKKIEILSQKRIRDRLIVYFKMLIENSSDKENKDENNIIIPLKRHDLASFLGVDRSALSRELSDMRDDELILFDGKMVKILDSSIIE